MPPKSPKIAALENRIRETYSLDAMDDRDNAIEAINNLIAFCMNPRTKLNGILSEMAKTIHRFFEFKCMAIAMKDPADGLYKYVFTMGYAPSVSAAYKEITYTAMDVFDDKSYPSIKISKYARFYMAEDKPYREGEEKCYSRPSLLDQWKRQNPDDLLEADYMNFFMYGSMGEVIGWLECSDTRTGKLPKRETVRWIETISAIVSSIIVERGLDKK
ncbi:MAG: hypothetical protein QXE18_07280 [Thermoplasmata archaeon]